MGFVIEPSAIIYISIGMNKSTLSIGFIILPPSPVHGTIWPNLSSFTLSDVFSGDPLSIIFCMIFKFDHWSIVNWAITMVGFFIVVSTHSCVVLHSSNFLSGQESSEICLDFNDKSQLLHCIVVITTTFMISQSLHVCAFVNSAIRTTSVTHFYCF